MPRNLLLALACSLAVAAAAQPTWRFHLAFEDGTGARDTLWFIYDTMVTVPYSYWPIPIDQYDSAQSNLNYGDGDFHVFLQNSMQDTSNSLAFPYTAFPMFETGDHIDAINWTPPMTITWDTSLFHAPFLPYDQGNIEIATMTGIAFSQFDQGGGGFGIFNMLITDSVTIDQLSDFLFPFPVYFDSDNTIDIGEHRSAGSLLQLWPNPARSMVHVQVPGKEAWDVVVSDLTGRRVLVAENMRDNEPWDVSSLHTGIYLISVRTHQSHIYNGTFQKIP
ncbi:MAG: T9SS type A sorting domain-containing protein [Flavobacteriales bacterium]|nr:T9SS type A sorting domain-containing protein [Flavobacteriales bacterium]MEB2342522.1 T9SS type A sorting domain-containing protein [Flavobacteriia bacterium]